MDVIPYSESEIFSKSILPGHCFLHTFAAKNENTTEDRRMNAPDTFAGQAAATFGKRFKARRKAQKLTLTKLAQMSSVSASTISKVENGAVSPTYDVILKLAHGLSSSVSEMFGEPLEPAASTRGPSGWQMIGRKDEYELLETDNYAHFYLCSNLRTKSMVPCVVHIKAGSLTEFGALTQHGGEEFVYVLKGAIELHSEFYSSAKLGEGDYAYLDSTMGHAYVRGSDAEAVILCVCAGTNPGDELQPI